MRSLSRALSLPTIVVAAAAFSGCPGCGVPFDITTSGSVVFPLGGVDGCDDNGSIPEDGEPDEFGNLTTFTHTNEGTICSLSANWTGSLLDMAAVREDVDAELEAAGLDPATVTVTVLSMEATVETVILQDNDTQEPIDLPDAALISYRGAISVDGDDDIIIAFHPFGGDPNTPTVTVRDSERLVELANDALGGGEPLLASGDAVAQIDMAELPTIEAAGAPAIVVTFDIGVAGEAGLGGGGGDDSGDE